MDEPRVWLKMSLLLGVKDAVIPKSVKTSSFINKIGGFPDHFIEPVTMPTCIQCEQSMCQIIQLYCPLSQSSYHRTLHVFSCINPNCSVKNSSWKLLREQHKETTCNVSNNSETKHKIVDCWGTADNSWDDDDVEGDEWSEQSNGVAANENAIDISSMMDSKCHLSENVNNYNLATNEENTQDKVCLKCYYLNVYEESTETDHSEHISHLLQDYKEREGKAYEQMVTAAESGKSSSCAENYEKTNVQHGNKAVYKFYKTISKCPEQCVRYQVGGKPITLTKNLPKAGSCDYCGADRQFEFQLMPSLVKDLTVCDSNDYAVEFGTVIFYTCSQSCWDDGKHHWREEECCVQDEEC
ncbi:programmed cell death protein 2-like [Argonauta hians]